MAELSWQDVMSGGMQPTGQPAQSPQMMTWDEAMKPTLQAKASPSSKPTFGQSVLQGMRDPVDQGARILANALPSGAVNAVNSATQYVNDLPVIGPVTKALGMTPATPEKLNADITERNAAYEASRGQDAGFDWGRAAGQIATTLPVAASGAGPISGAALTGAASGALQPVSGDQKDFWGNTAQNTALGAVTGAAGGAALQGASKVLGKPNLSPAVQKLMAEGVTPTPGQIFGGAASTAEAKASSLPVVGDAVRGAQRRAVEDLNVAAYNRALAPIGEKSTQGAGRAGVDEVASKLGDAYNKLLPNLQWKADAQFSSDLQNLRNLVQNLPPEQAGHFEKIIQSKVLNQIPTGTMDGITFKGIESELSRTANGLRGDPSYFNKQLGDAVKETLGLMRGALVRSNPQAAGELSAINQGYAVYGRIRDAASRSGSKNGVFSPEALQAAVRNADKSAGKGNFARGSAALQDLSDPAIDVLGRKYPDSGTAGRLELAALLTGAYSPWAALGIGAAALPYTAMGRKFAATALTQRPAVMSSVAGALPWLSPYLGTSAPIIAPAVTSGLLGTTTSR